MILIGCLCVCLVLVGLALSRPARTALEEIRLSLFGVRVRASGRQTFSRPVPPRPVAFPDRLGSVPPPRTTRAGP